MYVFYTILHPRCVCHTVTTYMLRPRSIRTDPYCPKSATMRTRALMKYGPILTPPPRHYYSFVSGFRYILSSMQTLRHTCVSSDPEYSTDAHFYDINFGLPMVPLFTGSMRFFKIRINMKKKKILYFQKLSKQRSFQYHKSNECYNHKLLIETRLSDSSLFLAEKRASIIKVIESSVTEPLL